ncbi:MAG: 6,7-dimethyl-8-ribityllumazine synthase [Bacteroidales bacterium]
MATAYQNLSACAESTTIPNASAMTFGIVVAEWNSNITMPLLEGAVNTLLRNGAKEENIIIEKVPGTFELTFGAKVLAECTNADAIITLGCVVRGDTPHFDFVCDGVTQGMTDLNVKMNIPFIFGVLTTDNMQQALDRAGGVHGNKGDEAAVTAIQMAALNTKYRNI